MKKILITCLLLLSTAISSKAIAAPDYEVRDGSYHVCATEQQYRQLLNYSLYGVGKPPEKGCFKAPAGAKAIILQCPESDIILCQFRLEPAQEKALTVWASKVMLREIE